MSKQSNPIEKLAGLLQGSKATPDIVAGRLAPSPIYDVDYRNAIIAMIFEGFAKIDSVSQQRRILVSRLKLLQFITFRPWLMPAVREWSSGEVQGSLGLEHSVRIRRGFLSDTAHDDAVNYLTACKVLSRQGSHLLAGERANELTKIATATLQNKLFDNERRIVSELREIQITKSMLEGW